MYDFNDNVYIYRLNVRIRADDFLQLKMMASLDHTAWPPCQVAAAISKKPSTLRSTINSLGINPTP